jgi:hypothetical protein
MFSSQNSQVSNDANYIEDVFSTYLYTGDSGTQTITNGVDLSTKGGMVWIKARQQTDNSTSPIGEHGIWDTARGVGTSGSVNKAIQSNSTLAENLGWTDADYISAFNTTGFTVQNAGGNTSHRIANHAFQNYVSWTFRKQPKFFDVVTFTSSSAGDTTFNHNLGVAAGCIILKNTQSADGWVVYHRSVGNNAFLRLNTTAAQDPLTGSFSVTSTSVTVNASLLIDNNTYVAYLFAHNAGGFGLTGTDNVISCGSMAVGGGVDAVVNLGYEPQWVMFKQAQAGGSGNWRIADNMRGVSTGTTTGDKIISANLATAEADAGANLIDFTSTGFIIKDNVIQGGDPYIYIAIRRGPMKVPTTGTSVFSPINVNNSTGTQNTTNFPVDLQIARNKASGQDTFFYDRLRRVNTTNVTDASPFLTSVSTAAEASATNRTRNWGSTGYFTPANFNDVDAIYWNFKRAPSFFDEVCYTGDSTLGRAVPHNLAAIPELMIVKNRNNTENWVAYSAATGNTKRLILNSTVAAGVRAVWADTTPTSTNFYVGGSGVLGETNYTTYTYVAYLFATCAGVSKVGSYTGTGTTKQIDCGFTGGARFVLIKRTDSTGDWYVWDTARGIVSGNDPYLLLNSTAAEVTSTDYIDTYSAGFEISSTAPSAINASGGTFIFLAIA